VIANHDQELVCGSCLVGIASPQYGFIEFIAEQAPHP
jgi:hypothetical protein